MRKLICVSMMGVLAMGLGVGLSGCTDEASTKKETIQTGPGGKTVQSETKSVKQSGENPPPPTKNP